VAPKFEDLLQRGGTLVSSDEPTPVRAPVKAKAAPGLRFDDLVAAGGKVESPPPAPPKPAETQVGPFKVRRGNLDKALDAVSKGGIPAAASMAKFAFANPLAATSLALEDVESSTRSINDAVEETPVLNAVNSETPFNLAHTLGVTPKQLNATAGKAAGFTREANNPEKLVPGVARGFLQATTLGGADELLSAVDPETDYSALHKKTREDAPGSFAFGDTTGGVARDAALARATGLLSPVKNVLTDTALGAAEGGLRSEDKTAGGRAFDAALGGVSNAAVSTAMTPGSVLETPRNALSKWFRGKSDEGVDQVMSKVRADREGVDRELLETRREQNDLVNRKVSDHESAVSKAVDSETDSRNKQAIAELRKEAARLQAAEAASAKDAERRRALAEQREILEAQIVALQSKSREKSGAKRVKAVEDLESKLAGFGDRRAALERSRDAKVGQGYQSDYQAADLYGKNREALSPEARERLGLMDEKMVDVANRRLSEPLPEERAQSWFDEEATKLDAERSAVEDMLGDAYTPERPPKPGIESSVVDEGPSAALAKLQAKLKQIQARESAPASDTAPKKHLVPEQTVRDVFEKLGLNAKKVAAPIPPRPTAGDSTAELPVAAGVREAQKARQVEGGLIDIDKLEPQQLYDDVRFGIERENRPPTKYDPRIDRLLKQHFDLNERASTLDDQIADPKWVYEKGGKHLKSEMLNSITPSVGNVLKGGPLSVWKLATQRLPDMSLKNPEARAAFYKFFADKVAADPVLRKSYGPFLAKALARDDINDTLAAFAYVENDPALAKALSAP
jgi:hypothetical protein